MDLTQFRWAALLGNVGCGKYKTTNNGSYSYYVAEARRVAANRTLVVCKSSSTERAPDLKQGTQLSVHTLGLNHFLDI